MSTSKLPIYTFEENYWSFQARALAHPARIKILRLLSENPEWRATDLCREIKLSQSNIHHHLRFLIDARLIEEIYRPHCYELRINKEMFGNFGGFFKSLN